MDKLIRNDPKTLLIVSNPVNNNNPDIPKNGITKVDMINNMIEP